MDEMPVYTELGFFLLSEQEVDAVNLGVTEKTVKNVSTLRCSVITGMSPVNVTCRCRLRKYRIFLPVY